MCQGGSHTKVSLVGSVVRVINDDHWSVAILNMAYEGDEDAEGGELY